MTARARTTTAQRTAPTRARDALGLDPTPTGTALAVTAVDKRISEIRVMEPAYADAVAQGLDVKQLIRDGITAVRNVPELADCSRDSFLGALMTAAQLGLRPNVPSLGYGWILPRWNSRANRNEAVWQLGYQGMVELGYRSRLVQRITAHTIYDGDQYRIQYGTQENIEHEPQDPREQVKDRAMVWHYATAWLTTGSAIFNAITDLEAQGIRDSYAPRNRSGSLVGPWTKEYAAMARKTALRGLWRFIPKSPDMSMALATDDVVRHGVEVDTAVATIDRDPVVPAPEPERETITVTPAAEPAAAVADAEPVEADAAPDAVVVWVMADGTEREPYEPNSARTAYGERIADVHGARLHEAITAVMGEWVEPLYLSTGELRTIAEHVLPAPTPEAVPAPDEPA